MVNHTNFLYYNTPINEFKTHYQNASQPYTKEISTRLPKTVASIRAVALCVFSTLVIATQSAAWVWPVAIASLAFAGWTLFNHILREDPLITLFYTIADKRMPHKSPNLAFGTLPDFVLNPNRSLRDNIHAINWDNLIVPVLKAKTNDGRKIMIIRALSRNPQQGASLQSKTIFAFVEKLTYRDLLPPNSNQTTEWYLRMICSALTPFNFVSDFSTNETGGGMGVAPAFHIIDSSVSPDLANELLAQ